MQDNTTGSDTTPRCIQCGKPEHGTIACEYAPDVVGRPIYSYPFTVQEKIELNKKLLEPVPNELGKRYNEGKLRWDLVPYHSFQEVVRVFTFGATKYDPWNWYKGLNFSNSFASGMRHRLAWWNGESNDKESGINHLAHSIWNDLANLTFELEGRNHLDDRIKKRQVVN